MLGSLFIETQCICVKATEVPGVRTPISDLHGSLNMLDPQKRLHNHATIL